MGGIISPHLRKAVDVVRKPDQGVCIKGPPDGPVPPPPPHSLCLIYMGKTLSFIWVTFNCVVHLIESMVSFEFYGLIYVV